MIAKPQGGTARIIPALDTGATALWGALRAAGVAPSLVRGWGRLFTLAR